MKISQSADVLGAAEIILGRVWRKIMEILLGLSKSHTTARIWGMGIRLF